MAVLEVVFGSSPLYQDNIQFRSGTAYAMTLDHAITAARTLTLPDVTDTVAVLGTAQTWTTLQTFNAGIAAHLTPDVSANSQTLNAAPTAKALTAANTKSFTATGANIVLPAITPAANGAGITLTGLNLSQGAISNVADSEAITVKQLVITGAAGAALATGVYTWTGADITMPAQAANSATNLAKGLKITGGTAAGGASATQIGLDITMAAATDRAISVNTGIVHSATGYRTTNLYLKDDTSEFEVRNAADSSYLGLHANYLSSASYLTVFEIQSNTNSNLDIHPNDEVTDVTERALTLRLLNATADTWLTMITLTPSAANPVTTFGYGTRHSFTASVSANSQTLNAAPAATTLTAVNTKSFTATGHHMVLPAITPAANGGGITLTGINLTQGAIANVADSEAITVTPLSIAGAAGAALATGVYTWTGADITMPAQAANAAVNLAKGIKITGGATAGAATATQIGLDITMAAATDNAIYVSTGSIYLQHKIYVGDNQNLILSEAGVIKIRNVADSGYNNLTASVVAATACETNQFRGNGAANCTLDANSGTTDATARTLSLRVLDTTGDAWRTVISMTGGAGVTDATALLAFHGATPCDQAALLADPAADAGVLATWAASINDLLIEKGLMAAS